MAKSNSLSICYPYGVGVTCICNGLHGSRRIIYKCFNSLEALQTESDLSGEAMLSRDDRADNGLGPPDDLTGLEALGGFGGRGLDEKTEIILAATFLVLIILAFISFVIYRCEKNYMRRRLQESFHLSPSGGGFFSSFAAAGHHSGHTGQIPSISVSVQTEPSMVNMNGNSSSLANTAALIGNGGGNYFQNGVNQNGVGGGAGGHGPGNYATLPHPHHHLQVGGNDVDQITQHWSRDNLLASTYDVNLTSFATAAQTPANHPNRGIGIHSRDNTLSRDMHHITEREMGLRSSCTTDNLRCPSVAGTNGRDDDDLNTDYAESDVMLGGPGSNSNNGSNNSSENERNSTSGNNNGTNTTVVSSSRY